ncbi:MAG: hypothetical protein R6U32_05940 [Candidatus Woesearchaeota archaeon]
MERGGSMIRIKELKAGMTLPAGGAGTALALVMISCMILSAGCSSLIKPDEGIKDVEIHTGTEGLKVSFLKNAPPSEIIAPEEGSVAPFQAGIEMHNKGAHDIKNGYLILNVEDNYMRIKGWDLEKDAHQIGGSGEEVSFDLDGKSQMLPSGGNKVFLANVEALPLERQSTTHESSISFTSCYGYETFASGDFCVDTDIYDMNPQEKTCNVEDISLSGGQGAPVSVDRVEVNMMAGEDDSIKPQFIIHISNKGRGTVLSPGKVRQACSASPLSHEDLKTVRIDDISFSGYSMKAGHIRCEPVNLKLRGDEDRIICTTKPGIISKEDGSYKTSLQVRLNYGYSQTISRTVEMNRP